MGSGTSSQVKTIHDTSVTNNTAVVTGKEMPRKSVTRTLPDPNTPVATHNDEEVVPPAVLMAQKSSSSMSHSTQHTPKPESSASSASADQQQKLDQLQKELNESESEKLDLQDRIQALEERLQEVTSAAAAATAGSGREEGGKGSAGNREGGTAVELQETLRAKDLYILQMEKQLAAVEEDAKKVKVRLRRKIKNLTSQLSEAKQESSIAQLELKEHNKDLQEQLRHSSEGGVSAKASKTSGEDEGDKDSKMKVILDLSAEVSEQSDRISFLERTVKQKDKEIERLKRQLSQTPRQTVQAVHSEQNGQPLQPQRTSQPVRTFPPQGPHSRHMKFTGPASRAGVPPVEEVRDYDTTQHSNRPISKIGPRPNAPPHRPPPEELMLHRQSTALSDSDSDWEVEMSDSKIHSAPARVRVKSATNAAQEVSSSRAEVDDKWSVATDDNDLTMTVETRPTGVSSHSRQKRRSALKTRLERERNERAKCLMGPSLAFAAPAGDQLSDVSATPTPRYANSEMGSQFSQSDVMAFVS